MLQFLFDAGKAQFEESSGILRNFLSLHQLPEFRHPLADGLAREKVYEAGQVMLYRYNSGETGREIPLLIIYALVNKPYMLDLAPKRSFLRGISQGKMDLYLIEWRDPHTNAVQPALEDYLMDIKATVLWIARQHQRDRIDVMGICQGGVFSLIHTALCPETVHNLITVVTPLDFHAGESAFTHIAKYCDTEEMSDTLRVIPGDLLTLAFLQMRPFSLLIGKYLDCLKILGDPEKMDLFWRMEQWIFDSPGQSGTAWSKFVHDCYQENLLLKNQMRLGDATVDLKRIECPLLNVTAAQDHIVPPASSEAIGRATSSKDYTHLDFPVGHIGMFVGSFAEKNIMPAIVQWLAAH